MTHASRFGLTIVVSTLLGPLVPGLAIFFAIATLQATRSELDLSSVSDLLLLVLVGAYLMGGVIALVAGMFIAIASLWYRTTLKTTLLAAVAANVFCYLATFVHSGISGPFPFSALLMSLALSLISAALCWLLLRRHFAH